MIESSWKDDNYNPSEHAYWKATLNTENGGYPNNYYYADTLRGIILAFGYFFSNLYVVRYDEKGYPRKNIQVPIKFGTRSKSHDFRTEQESGKDYYISTPNLTYKLTSLQLDANRCVSTNYLRSIYGKYLMKNGISEKEIDLLVSDIHPVPYNIGIELTGNFDKMNDATEIAEAITTKFTPQNFLYVKEFWFLDVRRDIKMQMDTITIEEPESMTEEAKREITMKCNFALECNFYKPIEDCPLIDKIIATLYNGKETTYNVEGGTIDETKPTPEKLYQKIIQ